MASKTRCPLTRKEFLANAEPLGLRIGADGGWTFANPKLFSTNSVGYCLTGKALIAVGDCETATQVSLNLIAVGSKDMAEEAGLVERFPTGQYRDDVRTADKLPSKAYFLSHAAPVHITIGTQLLAAYPKRFASGKVGWYANGKLSIVVNGTPVQFQLGINLVAIGSEGLSENGIPIVDTTVDEAAAIRATMAAECDAAQSKADLDALNALADARIDQQLNGERIMATPSKADVEYAEALADTEKSLSRGLITPVEADELRVLAKSDLDLANAVADVADAVHGMVTVA